MAQDRHWVKITQAFAIREKQHLYVHLESFDPDFRAYGRTRLIDLRIGSEMIRMRHLGSGDTKGEPVLVLVLDDSQYETVEEVRAKMGDVSDVFVARVREASD